MGGADELSGYALAISSAWGFSSALLSRSHIRIDTVYVRIKSIGVRAMLDLISLGTLLGFFAHGHLVRLGRRLAVLGVELALAVGHRGAAGDPAGPVVRRPAVLRRGLSLLLLVRGLLAFIAGDYNGLFALIGSKSALAEAEEEIAAVAHGLEQEKKQ